MTDQTLNLPSYNVSWREYHFQTSSELRLAMLEKEFSQFLSPHPLVQTSGRVPNEPLLGVIARWQGQIVGLILVEKKEQQGLVVCWHVLKAQRGFALGKKLLLKMERFAKSNELQNLSLSFREDSPFHPQITKTLQGLVWEPAKKELMLYKFSPKLFMQMPWCQNMSLPEGFEIFLWNTLTKQDRQHILDRQKRTNWYPVHQSPLFNVPDFEPANSVGLRLYGEVVGWMITHRVHADVIEYSSLFVSPELQSLGRGIHLIIAAVKRQQELGITRGIFQVKIDNSAMLSFVEKRMEETISSQTSRCFSMKVLT